MLRELLAKENKTDIARRLHVSRPTLYDILEERQALTAEMAIRFAELVGTEAAALLRMQAERDVWEVRRRPRPFQDGAPVRGASLTAALLPFLLPN